MAAAALPSQTATQESNWAQQVATAAALLQTSEGYQQVGKDVVVVALVGASRFSALLRCFFLFFIFLV